MAEQILTGQFYNRRLRMAVSGLFFLQGVCFASWASRIPGIQQQLQLSDAQLGLILFALPLGCMLALPFSGWLIGRFGSKRMSVGALLFYATGLLLLGLVPNIFLLVLALVLFGMAGNTSNISINTQAVAVEARYGRNIMASFHGVWSLAGFVAAFLASWLVGHDIPPSQHFLYAALFVIMSVALLQPLLLAGEMRKAGSSPFFIWPDRDLLKLGIIAFCCLVCEGAMFDWSGIYFQKVVKADKQMVGAGYTAFMGTMAGGRFLADRVAGKFGIRRTIQLSGLFIALGLGLAVALPQLITAIAGFLLVGFGVSAVVPLVYSEAGKSTTMQAGNALTAVTTIGFMGFLVGPPLIGLMAEYLSLRWAFLFIGLIGLLVMVLAGGIGNRQSSIVNRQS